MTDTVRIVASFAVNASTSGEATLPRERFDQARTGGPSALAALVDNTVGSETYVGVCHQCAHAISDPEVGELAGFTVRYADGTEVDYNADGTEYKR